MANAKKFYDGLSPQEKRFIDDKTMSTTWTVKNWITFLQRASAYDAYRDKHAKGSVAMIVVFIILTIISSIAYYQLQDPLIIIAPTSLAIITVWLFMRMSTMKSRDLNNYLRLFFMPFLTVMKDLAGEEAKLSAAVDFRDPLRNIKPMASKVSGRNIKTYEAKYIAAKILLRDGAYLETVVADDIKEISYRNPRGKYKSKKKTVHHYFQRLTLPKSTYKLKGLKLLSNMQMEETADGYVFKLKGKGKILNYDILTLQEYMQGIKNIYNQVQNINEPPADLNKPVNTPLPNSSNAPVNKISNAGVGGADAGIDPLLPAYMMSSDYFDRNDFNSMRDRDDMNRLSDDDTKMNIFDS
jgi:hypothetical protein